MSDANLNDFDYGDGYQATEAQEAGDFPVLPASKRRSVKNQDGSKTSTYTPRYLCELQQPAKVVTPNFPGAKPRLKFVLRSINPIPGTKSKGTVFYEIAPTRTPEQVAGDIDADLAAGANYTKKPGFERDSAIERRLGYQQRLKATTESLRAALGGNDPQVLRDPGMVGAKFAIAVDNREQNDGQKNANAVKFFDASEATDGVS